MAIAVFLFYFNNTMYCWLYSLKQWTISIEVPRKLQLESDPQETGFHMSKQRYNVIKWTGILVILALVTTASFYRFKLMSETVAGQVQPSTDALAFWFTISALILGFLTGILTLDAFRRFKKSFKDNHNFSENRCTMVLHVISLMASQLMWIVLDWTEEELLESPDTQDAINTVRLIGVITIACSQGIFIYLMIQFTKPFTLNFDIYQSTESLVASSNTVRVSQV